MRAAALALSTSDNLADRLDAIAEGVARLLPSHHDPERFHVDKDALVRELHDIVAGLPRGWTQIADQSGAPRRASFTNAPGFLR